MEKSSNRGTGNVVLAVSSDVVVVVIVVVVVVVVDVVIAVVVVLIISSDSLSKLVIESGCRFSENERKNNIA